MHVHSELFVCPHMDLQIPPCLLILSTDLAREGVCLNVPTFYVSHNVLPGPLSLTNPAKRKFASIIIRGHQNHTVDVVIKLVMLQKN